jgi:ABC-type nitrate/sulfonate/bicarbonate transport system substrate-binding protein/ActR/RegA family two-component response regulator
VNQERWGIVVDDRLMQAEAIAKVLTKWGLPSEAFNDPDKALIFAEQHRGTVVFAMFDLYLGKKSGADYARLFREQGLSHDVVLLTGYQDTITAEVSQELKRLGVPIYEKPINLKALLSEKLSVWRTITPEEMAQRPNPPLIPATGTLGDDKAVTVFTQATTANSKVETLSKDIAHLQGRLVERDYRRGWRLAWWQNVLVGLGIVVAIVLAIAAARCSSTSPPIANSPRDASSPVPTMHLVIAEGTQPVAAPVYVAYEKHFWKDLGLDVELVSFTSGRLCLDAVLGGKADAGTMAETPIMHAGFQGAPMYVVAGIHRSQKNTKVIASRGKGIAKSVDLKGHKVGVSIGTNGEFFMDQFLKRIAMTRKDLQVVNIRPEDMAPSLIRGDVDACFTWEPHVQNAKKQLGDAAVIFGNDGVYTETYNIVTTQNFAKSKTKELSLLLQGLAKAIDYIHENPDDSIGIVSRRIGMDANLLKAIWPDYTFQLSLEQSLLDLLDEEAKWSTANGIAPPGAEIPNYRFFVLTEPLKAVKPEAVTIK